MLFARRRGGGIRRGIAVAAVALAVGLTGAPGAAFAHLGGVSVSVCSACHGSLSGAQVNLAPATGSASAGDTATLVVTISNTVAGGFYLWAEPPGRFVVRAGEGTQLTTGGVTHTAPKLASGGTVTFKVDWIVPAGIPGAFFGVAGLAANNDGTRAGDHSANAYASMPIGCPTGTIYYRDGDEDGHGLPGAANQMLACARPKGFGPVSDDCNDNYALTYPGADEVCNGFDDNCNGMIDEGAPVTTLYPDADGDGYGRRGSTMSMVGCVLPGWGVGMDDCNDNDKTIHPDAVEICNFKDDDCDGDIDEKVRPTCFEGRCLGHSNSCDPDDTISCRAPLSPVKETCNFVDDDCNGLTDDGDLCTGGKVCVYARCVTSDEAATIMPMGGSGGTGPDPGSGGAGGDPPVRRAVSGCSLGGRSRPPGYALAAFSIGLLVWRRRRVRR